VIVEFYFADGYCPGVKVEFHPVVDGVGPRLMRAPFLGWGSGVAVAVEGGQFLLVWCVLCILYCIGAQVIV
jgi:hypothetical protein